MFKNKMKRYSKIVLLLPFMTLLAVTMTLAQAAGNSITAPDTAGDVSRGGSLVLDNSGNPVVSYLDESNHDLKLLHCNDPNCDPLVNGVESITALDTAGSVGFYSSLALDSNGYPVISYFDQSNSDLKLLHCNDPNCTGGDESITTPDTSGSSGSFVGESTSLALDSNGYPVVSYYERYKSSPYTPLENLKLLHCNDPNCDPLVNGAESIIALDTAGSVGFYSSLALDSNGYPVVSYHDQSNQDLKLLHCNDPNCAGGDESITAPDTAGNVGSFTSLALDSNGYPVVSYHDQSNQDLKLLHCNDPNCAGGDESVTAPDTAGYVGYLGTSLALEISGYPVVSYYDYTNRNLKLLYCNDPNCTGGDESIFPPDTAGDVGRYSSLALDSSGIPVVSYGDWGARDLKLLHCEEPGCVERGTIVIKKETNPAGSPGFGFTDNIAAPNSFTLNDGQSKTFLNVPTDTYEVSEDDPYPAFDLTGLSCNDGNSSGNLGTRTATIKLEFGETVTCTFTNIERGTIVIEKGTNPAGGTGFDFALSEPRLPPPFLTKWGGNGSGDGQFNSPGGVAVDAAGNVYVADSNNHRIQKFDSSGTFLLKWGSSGSGNGQFNEPSGLAVDAAGNVFVADSNNYRIQKFDSSGTFLLKWDSSGSGNGGFRQPNGVAVDGAGNVFVADGPGGVFSFNRIQKFDSNGTFLLSWGAFWGSGDGQFDQPNGVAVDAAGNFYVADSNNNRVQKFDSSGSFLLKWGIAGSGDGKFDRPSDVAVDAAGNVYVTDRDNHRVQKFDSSGNFLVTWGRSGSGNGQFSQPGGVAVNAAGNIYVVDSNNHRVQKFVPITSFTLDDGQDFTLAGLLPGTYTATENDPGTTYTLSNLVCDDGNSSSDLGTRTATINLEAGETVTCTFTNTGTNQPPSVAADQPVVTFNEGQTAANTGTISDPDGNTVSLSASVGSVVNNNGTWSWSWTTTDGPADGQTVTIAADDGSGGMAQTSFALTVNNVAPTVSTVAVPTEPIDINTQPVSGVSAPFNDPGTQDTHTCTVDYGDGNGPLAGTAAAGTCSGPDQTYAEVGVYEVTVEVTDDDTGVGSAMATTFIVIYDPSAGFVTGGGWIMSPEGACQYDECTDETIGKASFGFVSKYKKGAQVPTGSTNFQFKAGDLHFRSTSYEWLVVAGAKAKYKGEGTINGAGSYGFMLTATDSDVQGGGDVDTFRIKIWDKNAGDGVVYDNKMGADDDGYDGTELSGGNIKVHKAKK